MKYSTEFTFIQMTNWYNFRVYIRVQSCHGKHFFSDRSSNDSFVLPSVISVACLRQPFFLYCVTFVLIYVLTSDFRNDKQIEWLEKRRKKGVDTVAPNNCSFPAHPAPRDLLYIKHSGLGRGIPFLSDFENPSRVNCRRQPTHRNDETTKEWHTDR
jgi:hypothetical protein